MFEKPVSVVLISPKDYIHVAAFQEVAETLHQGLLDLGVDAIITRKAFQVSRQGIILGSNLLAEDPQPIHPSSILYNLEQVDEESPWINHYLLRLFKSHRVWDYDPINAHRWQRHGIHIDGVLPIGYSSILSRVKQGGAQDIDVLFIGQVSDRRKSILEACLRLNLKVEILTGVYGDARDHAMSRAKVILNCHQFESKVLEMVRLSYCMANRCAIVSERGTNPELAASLADAMVFSDYNNLPQACADLVKDEAKRLRLGDAALAWMQARPITGYLSAMR
jgi:hypothetical protein